MVAGCVGEFWTRMCALHLPELRSWDVEAMCGLGVRFGKGLQLVNVLRGQMSLVGPRPCIEYETELFEPHHFDRFLVPAGMTGLWQVAARAHATFKEALDLDAAYARNWSFGLDLWLLARTPGAVVRSRETV